MLMLCSSMATSSNTCCITLLCVEYMYSICADLLYTSNVALLKSQALCLLSTDR